MGGVRGRDEIVVGMDVWTGMAPWAGENGGGTVSGAVRSFTGVCKQTKVTKGNQTM